MKIQNAILVIVLFLLVPMRAFAQPTLGTDCPVGTVVASGSNAAAGKATMGPYGGAGTCTVTFATSHLRACEALNETNSGGFAVPEGGKTPNLTDMVIGSQFGWVSGDVISWQCTNF